MAHSATGMPVGVRLILETDAIVPPLTGIGRYALELLRAFNVSTDIEELKCFSRGRWFAPEKIIGEYRESDSQTDNKRQTQSPRWTRNPAKILLKRLLPVVQHRALSRYGCQYLYHSPNYRLGTYAGKKIATIHDLSLFKFPQFHPEDRRKILIPAIEQAVQIADHLITDTEQVRGEIIDYFGLAPEQVTAIPLASSLHPESVDPRSRDTFLRQQGLTHGKFFLFVSTLEPRKNIDGLLAAYDLLPEAMRRRYPLVLAGQLGWGSQSIIKPLQRGVSSGNVRQLGFLSNKQLCYLYDTARAFVYPSVYEGFGLPPIEAQGFGLPVITSNLSCLPEVVGDSGVLVDPRDPVALAAAMEQLVEDDQLHAGLVELGLANARKFSWSTTANKTIAVYRSVLDN